MTATPNRNRFDYNVERILLYDESIPLVIEHEKRKGGHGQSTVWPLLVRFIRWYDDRDVEIILDDLNTNTIINWLEAKLDEIVAENDLTPKEVEVKPAIPEKGTFKIAGTIVTVKSGKNPQYPGLKCLVKTKPGNKLWGKLPEGANRGDNIVMTASVKRSDDDPHFGFFSRAKGIEIFKNAGP